MFSEQGVSGEFWGEWECPPREPLATRQHTDTLGDVWDYGSCSSV